MNGYHQIKNQYQLAHKNRENSAPKINITHNQKSLLPDPDINRDNLNRMMDEYFKKGGVIKKYDEQGNLISVTQ